ncbi:hypothetical protein HY311_00665 [Candidatus Nomurabacteria bacterium]|nr:hypothetical protein [Candidatus Nomurabacteria bacterium]
MDQFNQPPSKKEKIKKTQQEKDADWLEKFQIKNTPGYIKMADCREFSEEDTSSFMSLINAFKTKHSLEVLSATTDADEETQKIRMAAKEDLNKIFALLKKLQNETKINQPQFEELNKEYREISQAIGILSDEKIDHTR